MATVSSQQSAAQSTKKQTATHRQVAAGEPSRPSAVFAQLDMLTRLQAVAVEGGDPQRIASTSRELNAEVLSILGTIAAAENRAEDAIDLIGESLQLRPDTTLQLRLVMLLAHSGKLDEAIAMAQQLAQTEPDNPRVFSTLGSVLRSAGKEQEASFALTRALQLDPNPSLAFSLGSALLMAHEKARADQVFAFILKGSDGAAVWHVAIGDAYREANYLEEAAAQFRQALALDLHATHAEFFLGLVSLQMNEWGPNSESFNHLRKAVEQNPHEYLSNFYLGALESTDGSDLASSDRHLHAAGVADPNQPEVWIYLGQNSNREHRPEEAIADLRKAVELTGMSEARNGFQIRRAYFTLGRLLIAKGDSAEGEKFLEGYKRLSALSVEAASATIAQKQGSSSTTPNASPDQSDGSLRNLSGDTATHTAALATTQPTTPAESVSPELRGAESQLHTLLSSSYNDLGTAEAKQQHYTDAQRDFLQAERFGGNSPGLFRNVALVALRLNDTAEVERSLTAYFGTTPKPDDPRSRLMLAVADFDLGHFSEAATNFKAAADLTTADPRTVYSYAFSLAHTGRAKEASALADLLASSELPAERLALVCNIYFTAENYTASATCYRRVVQQEPTFRTAHYFVAQSLLHQDHPADAIPELRQELALTPDEPNVQSALAFALSQTGQKAESQAMLTRTVAAHPEHADAQYQIGKLLAEQGKTVDAISHLEASVHDDDTKDYAHYQLASAYRKAGRTSDAEREFNTYRRIKEQHRTERAVPNSPSE